MALLHIPLDQIDEARLQALINGGAPESRTIEYKRAIYGSAHADYSEFLADTSSFANTSGGDLVLGMDATNGIPTAIAPFTSPLDPEILRLAACRTEVFRGVATSGILPAIGKLAGRRAGVEVILAQVAGL